MSEQFYTNARLYDLMYPIQGGPGTAADFYLTQAQTWGEPVLELACGTGNILLPIATTGMECVGLDLSTHMLAEARRKLEEAGAQAKLVEGDMTSFELNQKFGFIFIANNSMLHLHDTDDLISCLRCVQKHLDGGGRFAFDIFNPSVQVAASADGVRREVRRFNDPERGEVRVDAEARYDSIAQVMREIWYFSTDDEPDFFAAPLEVRCIFPQELPMILEKGGFRLTERWGDFEGGAFDADTKRQVCLCEPAG